MPEAVGGDAELHRRRRAAGVVEAPGAAGAGRRRRPRTAPAARPRWAGSRSARPTGSTSAPGAGPRRAPAARATTGASRTRRSTQWLWKRSRISCRPATMRFSSSRGSPMSACPLAGSRGRSTAPGSLGTPVSGAPRQHVHAVRVVELGRPGRPAAVHRVQVEGRRARVDDRLRGDRGGEVVGAVVEGQVVVDELAEVRVAGVDVAVLLVVDLALGGGLGLLGRP